jgi:hypothetical protein
MTVAHSLVGLFPRAVRERWGSELADETRSAGWRAWPDLVINLAALWIHPAIWPAESVARRRARAANLALAVTGAGWLTGHALLELSAAVPRGLAHSWILDVCDLITFLGFLLVLPLPRASTWPALVATAVRHLTIPVLLAGGVVVVVNQQVTAPRVPMLASWWLALVLGMIQTVRTASSVEPAPGPRRIRVGLWFAVLGLTLSAGVFIAATLASGQDTAAGMIAGTGLIALAAAGGGTIRDLSTIA